MDSWKIYKHTNKINGKCYIGQTKQSLKVRWKNGIGYDGSPVFYKAIQKYGWDNFTHEVIEDNILSQEEANNREIFYIKFYNSYIGFNNCNGYNATLGGDSKEHLGYPVYQINKQNYNIIAKFNSLEDAARGVKRNCTASIRKCCEGLRISAAGYFWCYEKNWSKDWKPKDNEQYTPIYQLDDDLIILKKYDSISQCVKQTGYSQGTILQCCQRKIRKANGFYWCYEKDYSIDWQPTTNVRFERNRKIYCFETQKTYAAAKVAEEETGASKRHILRCCKGLENGANGYHFCYATDKENYVIKPTIKCGEKYTDEENFLIIEKYPSMGMTDEFLSLFPNRTKGSLIQHCSRLGMKYIGESKQNKKVLCVETGQIFKSINDAYRFAKLADGSGIGRCCRGEKEMCGGYHWKYVEEE